MVNKGHPAVVFFGFPSSLMASKKEYVEVTDEEGEKILQEKIILPEIPIDRNHTYLFTIAQEEKFYYTKEQIKWYRNTDAYCHQKIGKVAIKDSSMNAFAFYPGNSPNPSNIIRNIKGGNIGEESYDYIKNWARQNYVDLKKRDCLKV